MLEWGLQVDGPITRGWEGGGGAYKRLFTVFIYLPSRFERTLFYKLA